LVKLADQKIDTSLTSEICFITQLCVPQTFLTNAVYFLLQIFEKIRLVVGGQFFIKLRENLLTDLLFETNGRQFEKKPNLVIEIAHNNLEE
jgi:hypothetical protein